MYILEDEPFLWFGEFIIGLALLFLTQLSCGMVTVLVIHSRLQHSHKLIVALGSIATLSIFSYRIFDVTTHFIGCIVGAVAMVFTTPLQAVACIERSASQKHKMCARDVVLRVAIPAALPSKYHANERPSVQAVRGAVYLAVGGSMSEYFAVSIRIGGLVADCMAVCLMVCGAAGALNIMSAVLGMFGILSPSPFRYPFLSTSLARFWGGNWNAPVSDALRVGLFKPLVRRGVHTGVATMACFLISGVAHELILLYCRINGSKGEWFFFFVIAGCMTVLEKAVEDYIPRRGKWTFCFISICIPFHSLFVPISIRTGLAAAGVHAISIGRVLASSYWNYLTKGT